MDLIEIVIETPGGSKAKYKYDSKEKCFNVRKLLPAGMIFPYDFGYIPGTKGEDKDPVDALVIAEFTTFPGCHMQCRLIGAILAEQKESGKTVRNDRFIFVPEHSLLFGNIEEIKQLSADHLEQLNDFFINYNKAEGKEFIPLEIVNAGKALELLKKMEK